MRVLILGGYGTFGGRLAELLGDTSDFELLVCGRDAARARAFCGSLQGTARAVPVIGARSDIVRLLAEHRPDVVVDATGPFQNYVLDGDGDVYSVPRAAIDAGVNYLDLADAAAFVDGISCLDSAAMEAGVFVLAGASSFPVLTDAVVRHLGEGLEVTKVVGGIAPSPYAGMGLNVMRAVLGYAGGPVRLLRDGVWMDAPGLAESLRYTIAPPGYLPLRSLRFSLVDVPDLRVIPAGHPKMREIWMGAAPLPEILHRVLNVLAWLRARSLLPNLVPFARLFQRVLDICRFGEHRGGMFVEIEGELDGRHVTRSWHMVAEGDDGPCIPSMAVEGILRKHLAGEAPAPGARPSIGALDLSDYAALFRGRAIHTGTLRPDEGGEHGLYPRHFGEDFGKLPLSVQALHRPSPSRVWTGRAKVRRGRNPIARAIAWIIGFPPTADDLPVRVKMIDDHDGERWERDFDGARFHSTQHPGTGRDAGLIVERFGIVRVGLGVIRRGEKLILIPRRWSVLGVPVPKALLPQGESFESEEDGRFAFNVTIAAPVVGLIVEYRGWLLPD